MKTRGAIAYGRYIITDDGQVIAMNYRNRGIVKTLRRYVDPKARCGGYGRVHINGRPKDIHRLVAECFVPRPDGNVEVNHKDGDKLNNCAANLEWVSHLENVRHAYRTGLITGAQIVLNARHPHPTRRTVTKETARRIKELICEGYTNGIIAEMLGIRTNVIPCIRLGQTYKDVPWPEGERRDCRMNSSEARWALHRFRKNRNHEKEKQCKSSN